MRQKVIHQVDAVSCIWQPSEFAVSVHVTYCNFQGKIDAISGSKKSVTVRSCARYPSNVNVEDFHSLFGYDDGATGVGFPVAKLSLNGGLNRVYFFLMPL